MHATVACHTATAHLVRPGQEEVGCTGDGHASQACMSEIHAWCTTTTTTTKSSVVACRSIVLLSRASALHWASHLCTAVTTTTTTATVPSIRAHACHSRLHARLLLCNEPGACVLEELEPWARPLAAEAGVLWEPRQLPP